MRRTKTQPLKDVIKEYIEALKMQSKLTEVGLINSWEKMVPPAIFRATKEIYIKDGKLFLKINSSVMRNELQLIKQGLMARLNDNAGSKVITDIIFL